MSSARIGTIDIALVYSQELSVDLIGSEARTANGTFMANVDAAKRQWLLLTRPMTVASRDSLMNYLESELFGPVAFWIEEFGVTSNTIPAFVTVEESRSYILPNRRSLTLIVEEE